jgi:glucose/arabinose dehydrogenase
MTKRARVGLLLILILIAGLFLVVRLRKNDESLPISAPIPPSSVPTTSSDLARLQLRLTPVASVASPTAFAIRSGDTSLYVTEQAGRVRRIRRGGSNFSLDDEPVLDITDEVTANGEQGLLGLAFASDGRTFYFAFTNRNQDQQLDEIAFDGDHADATKRRTLLTIPDFAPNHNGGGLVVDADGFLYWAMGDGGGAGDPHGSGQNPKDLLGDIARIDPAHAGTNGRPYAIPPDNPFADGINGAPEVWQYGLRNPWRFSFDRSTHDLWIADVGQGAIEEVDFVPAGIRGGLNFGWSDVEGTHPFRTAQAPPGAVGPIYEYDHSGGRCSITGGYVYRGSDIPALQGAYLFGDYCDGKIHGLIRAPDGAMTVTDLRLTAGGLSSFGEGADGEVYVLSAQNGVERIDSAGTAQPPTSS